MSTLVQICRFEFAHLARQRSTWVYAAVLLGLGYLAMTGFVHNARGELFNAPLAITGATVIASVLGLLISAALAADAATRDIRARIEPILFTTPLGRGTYLGGRFFAAFAMNALLLLAVPVGIVLAAYLQRLEPELVGPFRPAAYLGAYFLVAVPNAFVAIALLFSAAALTRTAVASYGTALVLFLGVMAILGILAEAMGRWGLAKLLDPFGFVVMSGLVREWTPAQKDSLLVGLQGGLLWNRVLWVSIALGALAVARIGFRFRHYSVGGRRRRATGAFAPAGDEVGAEQSAAIAVPHVSQQFGFPARLRQTLDIAWRSFRSIVVSPAALILAIPPLFLLLVGTELMEHIGIPIRPTTGRVVELFGQRLSGPLPLATAAPFLIIIYAGELIWREREARLSDITDATPVPEWVPLLGKFLGLGLVLVLLQALVMLAGILLQVFLGHSHIEPGLYLAVLFGIQLPEFLLLAMLALTVHILVNQKYLGHLVVLLAFVLVIVAPHMRVHNLLVYGADPGWSYSDLRGFEPFLAPLLWFKLYWAGWAVLLAVVARLLLVRGHELRFGERMKLAWSRLSRPTGAVATAAGALILLTGGFIFYNTNVLNTYRTAFEIRETTAEYERRYGQYEGIPQPHLTATSLHVELYPERRQAEVRGRYQLVNNSGVPIDSVHLTLASGVETSGVEFDRVSTPVVSDGELGYQVHALEQPLAPGEAMEMRFEVRFAPRGFPNRGIPTAVTAGSTYFTNWQWLPIIGYAGMLELSDAADRRAHNLPPRPEAPLLEDVAARHVMLGAEQIAVEAIIGTSPGQTAVAPGVLRRSWIEDGRRYFHYATDLPIRNDFAIYSADYAVHEAAWDDVQIQVVHHPEHHWNLERIVRGVQASLDFQSERFGPYPYGQIRFVEHPGGDTLHSAPINIAYEEGFSLFKPEDDWRRVDFAFAVVCHEVAHQWWGNQLTPAYAEGGAVLSESLAWYSAMCIVEEVHGSAHLERFMGVMREAYLTPRSAADVPLLRTRDWFGAFRRGAFTMYALREYLGEERVNDALRRLLERFPPGEAPLPTTLDLYEELRAIAPEPLHYLLADLFEANTFWRMEARGATAQRTADGNWQVTLDVEARKLTVDEEGVETDVPMDDLIEIGVYAPGDGGDLEPLYLEMHRVRSGTQRITVVVPREPSRAGIDPRHLLIDTHPRNNMVDVPSGSGAGR